jgi:hypothetical protein
MNSKLRAADRRAYRVLFVVECGFVSCRSATSRSIERCLQYFEAASPLHRSFEFGARERTRAIGSGEALSLRTRRGGSRESQLALLGDGLETRNARPFELGARSRECDRGGAFRRKRGVESRLERKSDTSHLTTSFATTGSRN